MLPVMESRFKYKGFPCVVLFMPFGFRCGYVGIPKGHRFYKMNYVKIPVGCHGGLTYSDDHLHHQDDKDIWWIGFDCAHYLDGYGLKCRREYFPELPEFDYIPELGEGYKGIEFCKQECGEIVDQIVGDDNE